MLQWYSYLLNYHGIIQPYKDLSGYSADVKSIVARLSLYERVSQLQNLSKINKAIETDTVRGFLWIGNSAF